MARADIEAASDVVDDRDVAETDLAEKEAANEGGTTDTEAVAETKPAWDWATDPNNPYNWPTGRKWAQVSMLCSVGFLT